MKQNKFITFLKDWMLPIAIVVGISSYLLYHYATPLHRFGGVLHAVAADGQRLVIAILLFCQFVKTAPKDLRLRRWHLWALLFQVATFGLTAFLAVVSRSAGAKVLFECAMICLICPTAAAAGVITDRLGGRLADTVSYLVLINVAATFLIPAVIPLVHPSPDFAFWQSVGRIAGRIFPILVLPCLLAWLLRFTLPRLQPTLERWAGYSFYVWGIGLTLAMVLSTHALMQSHVGGAVVAGIVAVSIAACALQFFVGRHLVRGRRDSVTAGQTLGQKNNGFLIWLGYSFLTPVTSIAGGLYAIWQNIFNSWELYRYRGSAK